MKNPYERTDTVARFYDTIYAKVRSIDTGYYLKKIAQTKGPVLEVGVGTGRIFFTALKKGADIFGIDASPAMIEKLKKKIGPEDQCRVAVQDAISMQLEKKFDLIIAPFRVFSHLITVEDQLSALDKIHDHLMPGGLFIFDVFIPNHKALAEGMTDRLDFEGEHAPGKILRRYSSTQTDPIEQLIHVTMRFVWEENGREMTDKWEFPLRYFFRYELEHLIGRSKLKLGHIFGDFHENELDADSEEFLVVCTRGIQFPKT
ncbi:MAG: class I SAM-dependent methyltransferase [Candidatus Aminicenantes bacterium]|nr:class I SAM-dependent methyltransferase [Candidatus Aminicenantes bacterium]